MRDHFVDGRVQFLRLETQVTVEGDRAVGKLLEAQIAVDLEPRLDRHSFLVHVRDVGAVDLDVQHAVADRALRPDDPFDLGDGAGPGHAGRSRGGRGRRCRAQVRDQRARDGQAAGQPTQPERLPPARHTAMLWCHPYPPRNAATVAAHCYQSPRRLNAPFSERFARGTPVTRARRRAWWHVGRPLR